MKRKNLLFTERHMKQIMEDAEKSGITFTEMLRRIIDNFYKKGGNSPCPKN